MDYCFDAFSSREPVSTSLENAMELPRAEIREKPEGYKSRREAVNR
jgi:hypothetical protein